MSDAVDFLQVLSNRQNENQRDRHELVPHSSLCRTRKGEAWFGSQGAHLRRQSPVEGNLDRMGRRSSLDQDSEEAAALSHSCASWRFHKNKLGRRTLARVVAV